MEFNFNLEGGNFSRAGAASSEIKKILKQLNVDALLIKRIVVALYEAEVNVVAHAYEGVMNVVLDGKSIVVTITDKGDRKSTRLNSSHKHRSRMPSSA